MGASSRLSSIPAAAAATLSTCTAWAVTSGPIPSPAITTMCFFMPLPVSPAGPAPGRPCSRAVPSPAEPHGRQELRLGRKAHHGIVGLLAANGGMGDSLRVVVPRKDQRVFVQGHQ